MIVLYQEKMMLNDDFYIPMSPENQISSDKQEIWVLWRDLTLEAEKADIGFLREVLVQCQSIQIHQ